VFGVDDHRYTGDPRRRRPQQVGGQIVGVEDVGLEPAQLMDQAPHPAPEAPAMNIQSVNRHSLALDFRGEPASPRQADHANIEPPTIGMAYVVHEDSFESADFQTDDEVEQADSSAF
jgi:hypothetical protein